MSYASTLSGVRDFRVGIYLHGRKLECNSINLQLYDWKLFASEIVFRNVS